MFWKKENKYNDWVELLPEVKGKYLHQVPLKKYAWAGVGGPAEILFLPKDIADLSAFLRFKPYNLPVCLIGGCSNLLIRDGGIPGVVIKLDSPFFKQKKLNGNLLTCFSGVKNVELQKFMKDNGLGGLEFLSTIPGVVGGSIKTNAGCFGSEVKDFIVSATIVDNRGQTAEIGVDDLKLSYRSSCFPDDWIITSITFQMHPKSKEEIEKTVQDYKNRRKATPYNAKTLGSTFKNPQGLVAGKLIEEVGLKGFTIGGAKVSPIHANFLINTGEATAKDFETLGEMIIEKVKKKTSITLEWEVKRMGVDR